ncbi:Transducin/WD40 repeat-like superfamily protein [Striga hermonthica]|uniref:Transducin/WD40 repeat-like superfamily protein n=1 Tax=Striga hermonthica TaxID=68872 RepID=A0A9N7RBN2_STRHE|nr:Transducin/WD40 repeat-like superfamily protein [Striga hermonthica]
MLLVTVPTICSISRDKGGRIIKWITSSWERIRSANVSRDPVSAFNVSPDGKLLAVALVSASLDSSARVTLIREKKNDESSFWTAILIILFAMAVYYARTGSFLPLTK